MRRYYVVRGLSEDPQVATQFNEELRELVRRYRERYALPRLKFVEDRQASCAERHYIVLGLADDPQIASQLDEELRALLSRFRERHALSYLELEEDRQAMLVVEARAKPMAASMVPAMNREIRKTAL